MADDKDDNGLKKAQEALKKAEKNPAFVGPQDSPKFKAAVKQLEKARANFKAAGGVSDATPAIIDPRGRGELDIPPAPKAPTSPSDQVRNAMVGMRPEGNLGELPQLPEGRPEAAGAGRIQTKAEVIAEDAKTKKRREKQAKQLRKDKALGASKKAAYDRGVAERARQAKVDTEAIRAIRERHDKDKPSAWEMGFATMTGGLGGLLFGTYDRYIDSSRAANEEVENFKLKNASDEAIRKALVSAKNTSAGAAAASYGWNASAKLAATKASSTLTSNAYSPHLFKKGVPNPLSGIGSNEDGDSKEQVRAWFTKRHTQAIKGNKKAIREIGAASSRIAGKEELFKDYLKKDLVIADNRDRHQSALIASIPAHYGITTSQGQKDYVNSFENIMHLEDKLLGQIDANNAISSYFDAMQSLADNGGEKYSKLKQAIQVELDLGVESKALKNIASMKEWMSGYENELTSIEKNLSVIKNAENAVVKLKAEAAKLRDNGLHGSAEKVDKKSAEAQRQLETILALSSHSDLKLKVGKDGRTETFIDGTDVKLIKQSFTRDGRSIVDVNHEYIESLPEKDRPAARKLAEAAVNRIERSWGLTPPATSPDSEGPALDELKYNAWKAESPEEFAIVQEGIEAIVTKIVDEEITYAEAKLGVGLNEREQQIMRSPYAKHMLLLWKADDDKGN
jgi:hypothetical protein